MKTYNILLRTENNEETAFRVKRFDALLGRIYGAMHDYHATPHGGRYLAEYALLTSLWDRSLEKMADWAISQSVDLEAMLLHRIDGSRAKDPEGRYMVNFGNSDYRRWIVHAATEHITGDWYYGETHPRPCDGILYDLPVWWFDIDYGNSSGTLEYRDNATLHEVHSIECVQHLQERCGFDIIPNFGHIMSAIQNGSNRHIMAKAKACLIEVGVDLTHSQWRRQIGNLISFCKMWPRAKKFIGIREGSMHQAAGVAQYIDDVCENCYFSHVCLRAGSDPNTQTENIRDWGYNPIMDALRGR